MQPARQDQAGGGHWAAPAFFREPGAVQEDQAAAAFKNGILTVTVPKSAEAKARKIKIQGG